MLCGGGVQMLLCDECDAGYHTYCLKPKLATVPKGYWFCDLCVDSERQRAAEDEDGEAEAEPAPCGRPRRAVKKVNYAAVRVRV